MTNDKDLHKLQTENARLKKTVEDLWTINHLARIISSTMPVDEVLDRVVEASLKAVSAEQGTISLLDNRTKGQDSAQFKTLVRRMDTSTPGANLRLNERLSDWMIEHRNPLIINDVDRDTTFKGLELLGSEVRSILSAPLLCKGNLVGVVNIFNKKEGSRFSKEDQRLLSIIASQSAQTIENARLYEEEKQLRKFEHEMELARRIQQSLLPDKAPEADRLDIASYFKPADKVGGDYFDYFELDNECIGVVQADVSGHGPPAALVMTMVKGILHAITHASISPVEVLTELNLILHEIGPSGTFVTMAFLVFDLRKRVLLFANAGHNPLIWYSAEAKSTERYIASGPALSIAEGSTYDVKRIPLIPGDLIIVYTDGVTEAFNEADEMFQESRLMEAIQEAAPASAKTVVENLKSRLRDFTGEAPQSDDIAVIAIKVT